MKIIKKQSNSKIINPPEDNFLIIHEWMVKLCKNPKAGLIFSVLKSYWDSVQKANEINGKRDRVKLSYDKISDRLFGLIERKTIIKEIDEIPYLIIEKSRTADRKNSYDLDWRAINEFIQSEYYKGTQLDPDHLVRMNEEELKKKEEEINKLKEEINKLKSSKQLTKQNTEKSKEQEQLLLFKEAIEEAKEKIEEKYRPLLDAVKFEKVEDGKIIVSSQKQIKETLSKERYKTPLKEALQKFLGSDIIRFKSI